MPINKNNLHLGIISITITLIYFSGLFHKAISLGMYVQHPVINFSTDHVQRAFELGKMLNFKGKSSLDLLAFLRYQPLGFMMEALRQLDVNLEKVRLSKLL